MWSVHVLHGKEAVMKAATGIFSETPEELPPASRKRLAKIAGVFYLAVGISGGFAEGYVDPSIYVAGDAATTAGNVVANPGLMRLGVVAHLTDAVFFLLTAVTLYLLLKHAGKHAGRLMVLAVIVAAGIISISAVFTFVAVQVATDGSYATAFGSPGSEAIVLLLLEIQHYAVLAAQVFFGLWLAPLGFLALKSKLFPTALGVMLIGATVSYLIQVVVAFLLPELTQILVYLNIVPAIAEIWMVLYLLIVGVRIPHSIDHSASADAAPIPA
jgi:hypothetical protein